MKPKLPRLPDLGGVARTPLAPALYLLSLLPALYLPHPAWLLLPPLFLLLLSWDPGRKRFQNSPALYLSLSTLMASLSVALSMASFADFLLGGGGSVSYLAFLALVASVAGGRGLLHVSLTWPSRPLRLYAEASLLLSPLLLGGLLALLAPALFPTLLRRR